MRHRCRANGRRPRDRSRACVEVLSAPGSQRVSVAAVVLGVNAPDGLQGRVQSRRIEAHIMPMCRKHRLPARDCWTLLFHHENRLLSAPFWLREIMVLRLQIVFGPIGPLASEALPTTPKQDRKVIRSNIFNQKLSQPGRSPGRKGAVGVPYHMSECSSSLDT